MNATPPNNSNLSELDKTLLAELAKRNNHLTSDTFQNQSVKALFRRSYTKDQLETIEALLNKKGAFSIAIADNLSVFIDDERRPISVVNATDTSDSHHGEMSYMIYLRDQIQIAGAYMRLFLVDPKNYKTHGETARTLMISALHLLSTPAQLARFDTVITMGNKASQEDWPHISLFINDLTAEQSNGWRNKQDTFQMLAYLVLDAIEQGFLIVDELLPSHRAFLTKIVPLLQAVKFPHYESSGSWEEITAQRTSVTAIEVALLHKIRVASDAFVFLYDQSDRQTFQQIVDNLIQQGLTAVGQQLPYESPSYDKQSIKYREADAALAYVLYYDLAPLLVKHATPIGNDQLVMTEQQIETLILKQLETLVDPATGGIARYLDDSYQRVNFHTNEVQQTIKAIKQQALIAADTTNSPINLDQKQQLRHELTPKGRVAMWTHPLGQIASWAALKSIAAQNETDEQRYATISTKFVNQLLRTITGEGTWNTVLDDTGIYTIASVPAFRLPECYITYALPNNQQIIVASPHTPLHWSNAMAEEAIALLRLSMPSK